MVSIHTKAVLTHDYWFRFFGVLVRVLRLGFLSSYILSYGYCEVSSVVFTSALIAWKFYSKMTCYYFALGRGANIAISVPVCLCVYLCLYICTSISPFAYLKNHMYKNKESSVVYM